MEAALQLVVHGSGNAWPVPLGDIHPFYDRNNPMDLSNAAFSLVTTHQNKVSADILVDAGHGTIQSLISGSNRIPQSICLTHGHMDHTLSVDWVVQSFWRHYGKERLYPLYATAPVHKFLVQSYPHLEALIEFRELLYGRTIQMEEARHIKLTAYPVYHGMSAVGACMLLFETDQQRVLLTGDLQIPLLGEEDYAKLHGVDLLVVDINNRFPWPRTNHWSFAGHPINPMDRSDTLQKFIDGLSWEDLIAPHLYEVSNELNRNYFRKLRANWSLTDQSHTILEFLLKIEPQLVVPVHYSGAEDLKYSGASILTVDGLQSWVSQTAASVGIASRFLIPNSGQVIPV